jgi:hypothetical protein
MHATYARELTAKEVDELPVVFALDELQVKRGRRTKQRYGRRHQRPP